MKIFQHIRIPAVWAVVAAVLAVSACEDPREEEAKFVVNRQTQNSTFEMAPEGGDFPLYVECDAEWTYTFKTKADWLSVKIKQVNSNSWMLTLSAPEYSGNVSRSAVLVFTAGERVREVTVQQAPEDPIIQVTVPGAYGVDGGDRVYDRSKTQISRLTDGDRFYFSLVYPADVRAVTVSVPSALEAGATVPLGYKVVEKDRTLVMKEYTAAKVLKIKEPYVWLKVGDTVYFVIRK
jgi:hypothetical protein